jgi:hypothetical protein
VVGVVVADDGLAGPDADPHPAASRAVAQSAAAGQ